jgi:hypothetical protein
VKSDDAVQQRAHELSRPRGVAGREAAVLVLQFGRVAIVLLTAGS